MSVGSGNFSSRCCDADLITARTGSGVKRKGEIYRHSVGEETIAEEEVAGRQPIGRCRDFHFAASFDRVDVATLRPETPMERRTCWNIDFLRVSPRDGFLATPWIHLFARRADISLSSASPPWKIVNLETRCIGVHPNGPRLPPLSNLPRERPLVPGSSSPASI